MWEFFLEKNTSEKVSNNCSHFIAENYLCTYFFDKMLDVRIEHFSKEGKKTRSLNIGLGRKHVLSLSIKEAPHAVKTIEGNPDRQSKCIM